MVTKLRIIPVVLALGAAALAGCDRAGPAAAGPAATDVPLAPAAAGSGERPSERLARRVALAMRDPDFRAWVRAQLDGSPFRERKLPFDGLLTADGGRARAAMARAAGGVGTDVSADAAEAPALEFYFPVPAHRRAWTGGEDVLVATALRDGEAPVAFDPQGRRHVLDPEVPPSTPVLALVPVETDFTRRADGLQACLEPDDCPSGGGGGGGGSGGDGSGGGTMVAGHLYMTAAHFEGTHESWLKGSPEFEVHILGQHGQTDSLMSYQCAGEHAGGPYVFDQNDRDWTGAVLLFSQGQFDTYRAAHPNQSVRILILEDDDTACQIKMNQDRFGALIGATDALLRGFTSGRDTTTNFIRYFRAARSGQSVLSALASWIKTNDDAVGIAVEDAIVGVYYPGYNWIVKGDNNITTGWVRFEMR
jgi:hypothetical protein